MAPSAQFDEKLGAGARNNRFPQLIENIVPNLAA
jgi:hypothetical protein